MYLHRFSLAAAGTSLMNMNHNDRYVKVKSKILNAKEKKHPANCLIIQKEGEQSIPCSTNRNTALGFVSVCLFHTKYYMRRTASVLEQDPTRKRFNFLNFLWGLIKGMTLKICMLRFVLVNSVLLFIPLSGLLWLLVVFALSHCDGWCGGGHLCHMLWIQRCWCVFY